MRKMFHAFLLLYIFTSFNREFRFFGFDLRYVIVPIALLLLGARLIHDASSRMRHMRCGTINTGDSKSVGFVLSDVVFFYALVLVSNIAWDFNGLPRNEVEFGNLLVLNVSNIAFAAVIYMYRHDVDPEKVFGYSLMSIFVLAMSMLWVNAGFDLPSFLHDSATRTTSASIEGAGVLGIDSRSAGFAEDPNYAALFCSIGIALAFARLKKGSIIQIITVTVFAACFVLAFSRTVLIGLAITLVLLLVRAVVRKSWAIVAWLISITFAITGVFVLSNLQFLQESASMANRFLMWDIARDLFIENPLIGGGISSVRSMIALAASDWYVQCHSTYWQILSEHGIICFVTFIVIIARRFVQCDQWWQVLAIAQFASLCLTSELEYQQVFVFVLVLLPIAYSQFPTSKVVLRSSVREEVD